MAELLVAGHGRVRAALGDYLREALPDDYYVVVEPVAARREFAAIVVGPGGLVVIEATDDPLPVSDAYAPEAEATRIVAAFLAEEFPTLHLPVRYCRAAAPGPRVTSWVRTDPPAWRLVAADGTAGEDLAAAILAAFAPPDQPLADGATRRALAVAFRDCQIAPSQRTSRPFVFRTGGTLLGSARQAWTIRDAIRHIEQHPDDGVYHLRNRTLEQWLAAEGALHLANLARIAGDRSLDDPRGSLEEFLIAAGLVRRPDPVVQPRRLDLGYIVAGESATGWLHIRKSGPHGYLLGHLTTSDPCLRVFPERFSGERVDVKVTVDTADLLIQPRPCEAAVAIHTATSAEPLTVPVRFWVTPAPSVVSRFVGRPLIGLLAGGLMGALIGLLWRLSAAPASVGIMPRALVGSLIFWVALFSLLWASLGVFRFLLQPPAWPVSYALLRWFYAILIWAGALGVFGATAVWCWQQGFLAGSSPRSETLWIALYYGAALSAAPATLQELLAAQRRYAEALAPPRRQIGRRLAWAVASAGLLLTLAIAPTFVRPVWERAVQGDALAALERRAAVAWAEAAATADELARQLYRLIYDRQLSDGADTSAAAGRPPAPAGGGR